MNTETIIKQALSSSFKDTSLNTDLVPNGVWLDKNLKEAYIILMDGSFQMENDFTASCSLIILSGNKEIIHMAGKPESCSSSQVAETKAIREGPEAAKRLNINSVIIRSDNMAVIEVGNLTNFLWQNTGLVQEIRLLQKYFESCSLCMCPEDALTSANLFGKAYGTGNQSVHGSFNVDKFFVVNMDSDLFTAVQDKLKTNVTELCNFISYV